MNPVLPADQFNTIFALLPWIVGIIIVLAVYFTVRGDSSKTIPIGQTFACANCGRRGHREHMVPVTHAGAISWRCSHCSKLG